MLNKKDLRARVDRFVGSTPSREMDDLRFALGSLEASLAGLRPPPTSLHDTEFKVFSQFGEDGAIQYLVHRLPDIPTSFIEIGVQDYRESNTRFLAMHDNWAGLAIDGDDAHLGFIRNGETGWRWSVEPICAFVTAESVNDVITRAGMQGEVGLLSIDVDGVDYWIWDAVAAVSPWVVIIEFNSYFGSAATLTVPYRPDFNARTAHHSSNYHGASLAALHHLGRAKGYRLVGATSNGINAVFVRDDVAADLWNLTPPQAYVKTRIRTQRDVAGNLTYVGDHQAVLRAMRDLPLLDVVSGETSTVGQLLPG